MEGFYIVFVHLGTDIPYWLTPNIRDHELRFKNDVVTVVNDDNVARKLSDAGVAVWMWNRTKPQTRVFAGDARTLAFRDGFWQKTSDRFLALADFQAETARPILQVETDSILFNKIRDVDFSVMGEKTCFPLASWKHGLGSVVFFPSADCSRKLAEHFLAEKSPAANSTSVNDMTRLASYYRNNPSDVCVLPTGFSSLEGNLFGNDPEFMRVSSANLESFGGVFDALTIGEFVAGHDSRNGRGFRKIGSNSPGFFPTQPAFHYSLAGDDLYVQGTNSEEKLPVYNLHVHSKQLAFFSQKSRPNMLRKRLAKQDQGSYWEFDFRGFRSHLTEYFNGPSLSERLFRKVEALVAERGGG